jgi:hypothetical protein
VYHKDIMLSQRCLDTTHNDPVTAWDSKINAGMCCTYLSHLVQGCDDDLSNLVHGCDAYYIQLIQGCDAYYAYFYYYIL